MGFFDKIFGSKAAATKFSGQKMTVLAPIDSTVIPLEQLPDETFATAILGPGCGLEPTGDMVYAPFDGTVTTIADTLHKVREKKNIENRINNYIFNKLRKTSNI